MGSRYLGIVSLERFLAVERYVESHQPAATARAPRVPRLGGGTTARRSDVEFPASGNARPHLALRP